MARYFLAGSVTWAGLTLSLVVVPSMVVMVLSLRWHIADKQTIPKVYWLAHICQTGIMQRYILMFQMGLKARRSEDLEDFDKLYHQQSDVCMLRMFESFLESAPQLVLQVYIMLSDRDYSAWTAITAFTSMVSLGWGIAAYTKAMRNTRLDKHKMTVSGLVLQTVWRAGMIGARVLALALVATYLEGWLLFFLALHLSAMFVWVVSQKTGFSATKWEEFIFNFIMAVTYCFCFFNLREGHSRWRMAIFYLVVMAENVACVVMYFFYGSHALWLKYAAVGSVCGLMLLGLSCMLVYYRFLHPMGPLNPFKSKSSGDLEEGGTATTQKPQLSSSYSSTSPSQGKARNLRHKVSMRRTFKSLYPVDNNTSFSVLSAQGISLESSPTTSSSSPDTSIPQPVYQRPSGTMCSVQDLLANVSCTSDYQAFETPGKARPHSAEGEEPTATSEEGAPVIEATPLSPGSFERTVTRELDFRLSTSEFQHEEKNSSSDDVGMGDGEGKPAVEEQKEKQAGDKDGVLDAGDTETFNQNHNAVNANVVVEKDTSNTPNTSPQPSRNKSNTSSLRRKSDGPASYSSPNCVGLPLQNKCSSHTSLNSFRKNESHRSSASILRTSIRRKGFTSSETDIRLTSLPHITTSSINITSKSNHTGNDTCDEAAPPPTHVPNVELAVIDRMHIIETESSGVSSDSHSDYENIYEGKDDPRKNLPPKPANLVVPTLDDTQTTQSSVPHDYENICAININRELGVRHWKTYSDIEDRVHDYSTYKERLKLLDSTLASSYCSEANSTLRAHLRRSLSAPDDCESVLSRSLPDLSTLRLETCLEETEPEEEEICASPNTKENENRLMEVLDRLRATRPLNKSNSVDYIPNYETIWVGDVEKPEKDESSSLAASCTSRSSLVVTIGDVREKESLCNLYYSTMSDLSFRYYSERMRRNCSADSTSSHSTSRNSSREMTRAISVPDSKTLLEVSELIEEQRKLTQEVQIAEQRQSLGAAALSTPHVYSQATPVRGSQSAQPQPRRKFSMLREKFEHPNWTPLKSPLKRRQSAQRRNSLQDRTSRALQAGMKVFRRPRVHVITPKKDEGSKDTPRLKSPFKSKTLTPTSVTIKRKGETPIEVKVTAKGEVETIRTAQRTPQVRTPADTRRVSGTPKTSTPDETKPAPRKGPAAVDPKINKLNEGPKTSTPEGNKQLPQMSILSAVSSVVASPDTTQIRVPLSENHYLNRVSSKTLAMQVNKESECTQRNAQSRKSFTNLRIQRSPDGDENSQNRINLVQSAAGSKVSQSHLDLKATHSSPVGGHRYSGGQAMFSGAIGLPRLQPEPRATIVSVTDVSDPAHGQHISHIVLSSPQSPKINMQKSTLSPNSKIFSRRI